MFGAVNAIPNVAPTWNMAPSQPAMVIRRHPETGDRHLDLLRWGLVPRFTKHPKTARKPINAWAETLAGSDLFRGAFARRRALVPATAFYEWRTDAEAGGKQPYAIVRTDGQPMAFAGLWEGRRPPNGEVLRTFAIITTAANATMRQLHDRMPVILEHDDWPVWLWARWRVIRAACCGQPPRACCVSGRSAGRSTACATTRPICWIGSTIRPRRRPAMRRRGRTRRSGTPSRSGPGPGRGRSVLFHKCFRSAVMRCPCALRTCCAALERALASSIC